MRHEIRPIGMRYLISGLRAREHQSGEVGLSKIYEVCGIFSRLKFVSKLEEQIGLNLVRLLF